MYKGTFQDSPKESELVPGLGTLMFELEEHLWETTILLTTRMSMVDITESSFHVVAIS